MRVPHGFGCRIRSHPSMLSIVLAVPNYASQTTIPRGLAVDQKYAGQTTMSRQAVQPICVTQLTLSAVMRSGHCQLCRAADSVCCVTRLMVSAVSHIILPSVNWLWSFWTYVFILGYHRWSAWLLKNHAFPNHAGHPMIAR